MYRTMEAIVRQNATFQRTVKPHSFRTWEGKPDDAKDISQFGAPAMRWTPTHTAEQWATPHLIKGGMFINCEIWLQGTNVSDMTNFWWMLVQCFYPGPPITLEIIDRLQKAGAHTGLVEFSQPAYDPQPDGLWMAGGGQLAIIVRSSINP